MSTNDLIVRGGWSQVSIAPDGCAVASIDRGDGDAIVVLDLQDGLRRWPVRRAARSLRWTPAGDLVVATADGPTTTLGIAHPDGAVRPVGGVPKGGWRITATMGPSQVLAEASDRQLCGVLDARCGRFTPVDLPTGARRPIVGPGGVIEWALAMRDGRSVALHRGSRSWHEVAPCQPTQPRAVDEHGRLWLLDSARRPTTAVVALSPDGRVEPIFDDPRFDAGSVVVDPWTMAPVGATIIREGIEYEWLDAHRARWWDTLARPDAAAVGASWALERERAVVTYEGPREPGRIALVDGRGREVRELWRALPALDRSRLASMSPETIEARDGLRLPAYVTTPPTEGPWPTVVLLHGGPWARDLSGFHSSVQALAASGFAVVQVNHRGSSGYGAALLLAARGELTGAAVDDVVDAARWAIARGVARSPMVVAGLSFGGLLALLAAARAPELFSGAASCSGPIDLDALVDRMSARDRSDGVSAWRVFVGDADAERSPRHDPPPLGCELLLVHGADDDRVPVAEVDGFARARREAGGLVTFHVLEGTGHHIDGDALATSIDLLVGLAARATGGC